MSNRPDASETQKMSASIWRVTLHHEAPGAAWIWTRFAGDGKHEETSGPQPQYRKALLDALTHGFRPEEDCLTVDLAFGTVHFPSGRTPVYVGHGSDTAMHQRHRGPA